jgi:glycosyltransferase involved in cell wall biosynthesis
MPVTDPDPGTENAPHISVVISVQNRIDDLTDCLRALGRQTLARSRYEVVVVDNCSSVDLGPVFERARGEFGLTLTTLRTESDRGPAPARNRGVQVARGAIIAFTDSDCRPAPNWLADGLAAFEADASVGLVCGPIRPKPDHQVHLTSKLTFQTEGEHPTYPTANLMLRRAAFLEQGGFNTSLSYRDPLGRAVECADSDLAWRIIKTGVAKRFVATAVVYHSIEQQPLSLWLLEGTRLFSLPELVRRHPELRTHLLRGRWFFYPRAWALVGLSIAWLVSLWFWPWLLPATLGAAVVAGSARKRSLSPAVVGRFVVSIPLQVVRMAVMLATLLLASLRFRSLVL